ncbi:LysR family transcriptional regulator [Rhodobacterales bacterium 52_120_T64]|nr:LysR family transcriptional regulator [Rhodobacterales bacterium 52_120_T64]
MGQVEDLRLFVKVVESGSISKAAGKLRIAKSAVSRRLGLLEERYGTRLIDRVPGVWEVTETGRELYQRAMRVVGDVDEIEDDFVNTSADLTGPLSVSVPRDFGIAFLNDALIAFKQRHPEIQLAVDFDDRTVDLARENYDFAIRIKPDPKGGISTGRIGTVRHRLIASPEYIQTHSDPRSFDDLRQHPLMHFGTARRAVWDFVSDKGKPQPFEFQPFLNSNSGVFLLEAIIKGLGIGRLPDFIISDALASGKLVEIMSSVTMSDWGIYLMHAEERRLNRRMRLFAEEIQQACLSQPGGLYAPPDS